MGVTEIVAPNERAEGEGEHDDGRGACHLTIGGGCPLCGDTAAHPALVLPSGEINCLGPVCDGPNGCGRQRCPRCATAWLEQHTLGRRAGA